MRYAMQSWEGDAADEFVDYHDDGSAPGHWESMHEDDRPAIAKHWAPKATALEAAIMCRAWTGFVAIPAMQVVDLQTGDVVWRSSESYPAAGPVIELPEEHLVAQGARAIWNGERRPNRPESAQESLF